MNLQNLKHPLFYEQIVLSDLVLVALIMSSTKAMISRNIKSVLFLLLSLMCFYLSAQDGSDSTILKDCHKTHWKGFDRCDFIFNEKHARVVIPNNPLPGQPWIWRARFPDWHTETDSILISEGFHLAYIDTRNQYGSPHAIKIWDDFYDYITSTYKLQKKVSLMAVSRGGLFAYNWAKKNPEKVICIYAEAPVCDFNSWPAGFGASKGSLDDWKKLKEEYGFNSDANAKEYANNPIDKLHALALAKVPILHMIGLNDKIVPVDENTMPFINKYISLGGIATVVACTKGEHKLEGHHFLIETPRTVADFIKYHTQALLPLSASVYHRERAGLKNSQIKFERSKEARVAFLGGSITYNSGWRDSISAYLIKRFPETEFEFIVAGIPSMGSTPAAFRLERDVLSKSKIDLLFEEAAVNDASNGRTTTEQIRAMEGIIRHARIANAEMDIILMHFVDPDKIESYNIGLEPEVITNHNSVAEHYAIPTINLAKEVTDRINNGEFTWEDDFKNLHPSPFGQGIYANSMINFLASSYSDDIDPSDKISPHCLPEKLDRYSYDNGYLINIATAKLDNGWHIDSLWNPKDGTGTRFNYVDVPMLISETSGSNLQLNFKGTAVGIAVAAGKDVGHIEYRIDKKEWRKVNLFTKWSKSLHLPWYFTLASELSDNTHLLELRIAHTKDEASTGNACRIRYFYVNG